jgi:hypothetical protein
VGRWRPHGSSSKGRGQQQMQARGHEDGNGQLLLVDELIVLTEPEQHERNVLAHLLAPMEGLICCRGPMHPSASASAMRL